MRSVNFIGISEVVKIQTLLDLRGGTSRCCRETQFGNQQTIVIQDIRDFVLIAFNRKKRYEFR
jgi:hypothetical protein